MTFGEIPIREITFVGIEDLVDNREEKVMDMSRDKKNGTIYCQEGLVETRSEADETVLDPDDLLEEMAIECAAEGYVIKQNLELAIDEHLKLQKENETWKGLYDASKKLEEENHRLTLENKTLIDELDRTKKEIHACKIILADLELERKRSSHNFQGVVDLTNMPDDL
eukprot:scaffold10476_cov142-Cylindrotheca_fusiformis.AAC.4